MKDCWEGGVVRMACEASHWAAMHVHCNWNRAGAHCLCFLLAAAVHTALATGQRWRTLIIFGPRIVAESVG